MKQTDVDFKGEWITHNEENAIIERHGLNGWVFSRVMVWGFLDFSIARLTLQSMIFALVGVSIILIFTLDLRVAILVIFTVIMIDVDLFGLSVSVCLSVCVLPRLTHTSPS